jgi:hypothetical protein
MLRDAWFGGGVEGRGGEGRGGKERATWKALAWIAHGMDGLGRLLADTMHA